MSKKKNTVVGCRIAALASIVFLTMGYSPVQAQQVYRCVRDGRVSFQSVPCEAGSAPALQPVYKCVKDGKTSFQGAPCETGSASALQPGAAGSQLPWEGLRPGMLVSDVRRTMADALTETKGTGVRLRRQGLVIAGIVFNAEYNFDGDEQLESVQLTKAGEINEPSANNVNLADYEKLATLMRARYGAKISSTIENGAPGASRLAADTQWAAQGGKVSISITPRTATTSTLSLGYLPGSSARYRPESSQQQPVIRRMVPSPAPAARIRRS